MTLFEMRLFAYTCYAVTEDQLVPLSYQRTTGSRSFSGNVRSQRELHAQNGNDITEK